MTAESGFPTVSLETPVPPQFYIEGVVGKTRPGSSPDFGTIFYILSHPWGIKAKVGSPFSLCEIKKVRRGMGIVMKRLLVLLMLMMYLFLTGCGAAARQSEF